MCECSRTSCIFFASSFVSQGKGCHGPSLPSSTGGAWFQINIGLTHLCCQLCFAKVEVDKVLHTHAIFMKGKRVSRCNFGGGLEDVAETVVLYLGYETGTLIEDLAVGNIVRDADAE